MEIKADVRGPSSAASLAQADKQISSLFQKHLPAIPHIFFVPTNHPYLPNFPHENRNIPFERCEIPKLQYMTLISNGDRGVGASKGASDWEDDVYGKSPLSAAGHSSTSTPNPVRDLKKPSQKISFGDYKHFKQTGFKPSPRPYTATPEQKAKDAPGHSRNTSAISSITPMGRVPSSEGGDFKPAVTKFHVNPVTVEKTAVKDVERSAVSRSTHTDLKAEKPRPHTNGHHLNPRANTPKDSKVESRASTNPQTIHSFKEPLKYALPPRPQSPPRSNPEHKKRPLESGDTNPEKRVKISHLGSRTPSGTSLGSLKDELHKLESAETKPSTTKSHKSGPAVASPLPRKSTPVTKSIDSKSHTSNSSSSDKPIDLPPLLSPLPADLGSGPEPTFASAIANSESDKSTPPKTPSQSQKKAINSDTIVVRQPHSKSHTSSPSSDPLKYSTLPFVLPPLLSPSLPSVVEAELLRLQQKSAIHLNTVEARHEKARLPDAPGVARKTPRNAKVGHPPKRSHAESSKLPTVPEKEVKRSLIVKIRYSKKNANNIKRILALTQKPRGQMEKLETGERLARERSTSAALPLQDGPESEEDIPLAMSRPARIPAVSSTASKKRPSESTNESASKRSKLPAVDVPKASTPLTPAFKSPALSIASASAQKGLLATPKKGDAMRNVVMRRADSNDGLPRTPHTTSSTPASAEKHRPDGIEARPNPELDKQKAAEAQLFPMGTMLKRKMDSLLSVKNRDPSVSIPESSRKVGLCIGIESLMAYMLAFQARDRIAQLRGQTPDPSSWDSFVKLQVFLAHSTKPYIELYALVEQVGALAREMLNRTYVEYLVSILDGGKIEKVAKELRDNSRARDTAWMGVKRNEKVLKELGVDRNGLGPWSMVQEAVALAGVTLNVYCAREKLDWSPDVQFATAMESSSRSK